MLEEKTHSKIGASSMSRWSKCPGSVRLSADIPGTTSSYAAEGTLAHEMAEKWLRYGKVSPPPECGHEMAENVRPYVEIIRREIAADPNCNVFYEHKFDLSKLRKGLYGTADCVIYFYNSKILKVFDLKYGAGIPVEALGNMQMQYYGLGAMISLGFICKEIHAIIVQPRCQHELGPIRTSKLSSVDMLEFMADLIAAAKRTEDPNAPLLAGKHCRFCPAAGICPEIQNQALRAAQAEFLPTLSYDPQKLSDTLEKLPLVETWIKGVRDFAYKEAERGREIPGFKLVDKRPVRKWINEDKTIEILDMMTSLTSDKYYDKSLKSVAQVESLLSKDEKKILNDLVEKVSSGKSLVHDSDSRPSAVDSAKLDFEEIKE